MKKITLLFLNLVFCFTLFAQINIDWQSNSGGSGADEIYAVLGTSDGGVITGGFSTSGISGNKTVASYGATDYWVIKYNDAGAIEWQKAYGGSSEDYLYSIVETDDGGFLLGGSSQSGATGVKTEALIGVSDYWIIKIDATGNIVWQNTIGGNSSDNLNEIAKTYDGGFILAGYSFSGISGDKSENPYNASSDYWIVKIDSVGNIVWQNTIGGNSTDNPKSVYCNPDGTSIVLGYSLSGATGDKTEANLGNYDFWVLKLSAAGGVLWQNSIGGNNADMPNSVVPAIDGGIIIGGYSGSGISGDKTEALIGIYDYWILKLNTSGNILWQNTIGGTSDDYLFKIVPNVAENKYFLFGYSYSGIGGDKTEAGDATANYWMLETNLSGTIVGQETIQATGYDFGYDASICVDGDYVVGGKSNSGIGGDKTENNNGDFDFWLVKMTTCEATTEVCNTLDDDCDGLIDEGVKSIFYGDSDGDGFGVPEITILACSAPEGYADIIGDCYDANPAIYPGATEICNGVDDNCTGSVDEGLLITFYADNDGDSYGDPTDFELFCEGIAGYVEANGDCNDANNLINPGATELCNNIDDNCDGNIDEGLNVTVTISASGPTTICQGSNVTLTATHNGDALQWKKNGVNIAGATSASLLVNATGNYTCMAYSDCDTNTSSIITVTVNKNPKAIISAGGPTTFCAGGNVTLTETPSGGCTYQWFKGAAAIPGATGTTYVATTTGNYKCRVTKTATGCFKLSNAIAVLVTCKEGEELTSNNISIYPNPTSDKLNIVAENIDIADLKIINSAGEIVQIINNWQNETVDVANLPAGIYYLQLLSETEIFQQIFVKQ